jgi:hypothetical protein
MAAGQPGEAYNVTDGGRHPAGEIIRLVAEAQHRSPWLPPIRRWVATCLKPFINIAGRLLGQPELARLDWQEMNGVFSDYHFSIAKITALGYAPRIDARTGLQNEIRRRGGESPARRH